MFKTIKSYLTIERLYKSFTDIVSGKAVCVYQDCYGDLWLKDSRWSFFRVKK